MIDFIRPILARVLGAWIAAACLWLAVHYNITIAPDEQSKVVEAGIIVLLAIFNTLYALIHRAISVKTNPSDAATPSLAAKGKSEQRTLDKTAN